ncbi:MAG: 23S rRNA (cytosine(1962)-C(5))-methyltransferase RlmI, partial [bacterium]
VFEVLRTFRDSAKTFDMIILDPPKFADSKGSLMKASRGYKDINLLGMKLLRPGGLLATFSCSGLMTAEMFDKVVADAAVDAKRDFQVIKRLQQSEDHPEGLCFPEGLYLKGLFCRVI